MESVIQLFNSHLGYLFTFDCHCYNVYLIAQFSRNIFGFKRNVYTFQAIYFVERDESKKGIYKNVATTVRLQDIDLQFNICNPQLNPDGSRAKKEGIDSANKEGVPGSRQLEIAMVSAWDQVGRRGSIDEGDKK